jgi:parallel beta-helix repeat protein
VADNDVNDNEFGGIAVVLSSDVRLERNTIHDTTDGDGVTLVADSDGNSVRHNTVFDNGGGIGLQDGSDRNQIAQNTVRDNLFAGMYLIASNRNRIERNLIVGNAKVAFEEDGFSDGGLHISSDEQGEPSNGNLVTGNRLASNFGDGVLIDSGQAHNELVGNLASLNLDDGFDVDEPGTLVARNVATRNEDLGIEAVAGVRDGGNNRASANGDPRECTHVVCR